MKQSQNEKILKHLKTGRTITVLDAFKMGICCLHKRLAEIRDEGYKIGGYMARVKTRDGTAFVKKHYLCGRKHGA